MTTRRQPTSTSPRSRRTGPDVTGSSPTQTARTSRGWARSTSARRRNRFRSLEDGAPFVLAFATPKYCESRTCGPTVEVVQKVQRQFKGSGIRFLHVEVYEANDPAKGYNRWMREWNLPTEPWVFLVDGSGIVRAKFEGSVSVDELAGAVEEYMR